MNRIPQNVEYYENNDKSVSFRFKNYTGKTIEDDSDNIIEELNMLKFEVSNFSKTRDSMEKIEKTKVRGNTLVESPNDPIIENVEILEEGKHYVDYWNRIRVYTNYIDEEGKIRKLIHSKDDCTSSRKEVCHRHSINMDKIIFPIDEYINYKNYTKEQLDDLELALRECNQLEDNQTIYVDDVGNIRIGFYVEKINVLEENLIRYKNMKTAKEIGLNLSEKDKLELERLEKIHKVEINMADEASSSSVNQNSFGRPPKDASMTHSGLWQPAITGSELTFRDTSSINNVTRIPKKGLPWKPEAIEYLPMQNNNGSILILTVNDPQHWEALIDQWESDAIRALESHSFNDINAKWNFIENLLGPVAKKYIQEWRDKFPGEYDELVKLGDSSANLTAQVRKIITGADYYRGDTIVQDRAVQELDRITLDNMSNFKIFSQ